MKRYAVEKFDVTKKGAAMLQLGAILFTLYVIGFYNYLLFHTLAEIITVVIALGIFTVAWNSRRFLRNNYYLLIGIAFFASGGIDLIHALTYKGIGIVSSASSPNVATQLWLAGRYIIAASFLGAPFFINRKLDARKAFSAYLVVSILLLLSIFLWRNFPTAYADGVGLTVFKKVSEYVIATAFAFSLGVLYLHRNKFDQRAYRLLTTVLALLIVSEISFTLYVGVYDFFNLLGHLVRIAAYYVSYLAIVELGLMKPCRILFKEVKDSEVALKKSENEREIFLKQLQVLTREAQGRADELNAIFNSLVEPVIICNKQGAVISSNFAATESLGIDPVGFDHRKITEKLCLGSKRQNDLQNEGTIFERALGGETISGEEYIFKNALHETRTASIAAAPIKTRGEIVSAVVAWHDITEEKAIEKQKDEFISLASHQLRTPLASISLSVELLLRGVRGELNSDQKEYLRDTFDSAKRMSKLISNLLNVSRLEMGTFAIKMSQVDIKRVVDRIVNELRPGIEEKKIDFSFESGKEMPMVHVDENVMEIIIENLLTNAIRYTPEQGCIKAKLEERDENGKNYIMVKITDTGCGIPEKDQVRIFDKSFRGSNVISRNTEGSGLGLYLVKSLAERCGSKIWLESAENKGTTFFVKIPCSR